MNNSICLEAIRWGLRQFSYKDFVAFVQSSPALKSALTKGGFSLNANNFRQENTVRRLLNVLSRREEFAQSLMTTIARGRLEVEKKPNGLLPGGAATFKWLEEHWRDKFAEMADARPLAILFYRDEAHVRLARMAELLMKARSFWKTGKSQPRGKAAATRAVREHCMAAMEKLIVQKRQGEPRKEENLTSSLVQPMLPGLLPLTASSAVEEKKAPEIVPGEVLAKSGEEPKAVELAAEEPSEAPMVSERAGGKQPEAFTGAKEPEEGGSAEKMRQDLSRARQRNGELSRENDALRKNLRTQKDLHEKALNAQKQETEKLQRQLAEVKEDFDDAIDELRDEFTQVQQNQMNSFYAQSLGIHPEQLSMLYEAQNVTQNLRGRVDKLLSKQREMDKKYGTVERLQNEERNLEQMLQRVRGAIENAINVVPGLGDVEKELERKLVEIRHQLRKDPNEGECALQGILPRLLTYLKETPLNEEHSLEKLQEVEGFLRTPLANAILAPDERKNVQDVLEDRRRKVQKGIEVASKVASIPEEPMSGVGERMSQVIRMDWYLEKYQNIEIYIDGYNVIKLDPILSVHEKAVNGFQSVRDELIGRCRRIAKLFRKVVLVFDGNLPTDSVSQPGDNLTVVYAAKKNSDQNAGNWIVQRLAEEEAKDEAQEQVMRWIVTNDHGLRARVANLCDGYVDNATLAAFMAR